MRISFCVIMLPSSHDLKRILWDDILRIEFQLPHIRGHCVWHAAITDPHDHRKLNLPFFMGFREQGWSEDGNVKRLHPAAHDQALERDIHRICQIIVDRASIDPSVLQATRC